MFFSFPCGSAGKDSACNVGDLGLIPGLGRFPGEEKGYPIQYSGQENSMDCIVYGAAKSRTWLSNFHSLTHTPITSWKINELEQTMETVTDFSLGGSKVTADGDCSHEIKRHLLFVISELLIAQLIKWIYLNEKESQATYLSRHKESLESALLSKLERRCIDSKMPFHSIAFCLFIFLRVLY